MGSGCSKRKRPKKTKQKQTLPPVTLEFSDIYLLTAAICEPVPPSDSSIKQMLHDDVRAPFPQAESQNENTGAALQVGDHVHTQESSTRLPSRDEKKKSEKSATAKPEMTQPQTQNVIGQGVEPKSTETERKTTDVKDSEDNNGMEIQLRWPPAATRSGNRDKDNKVSVMIKIYEELCTKAKHEILLTFRIPIAARFGIQDKNNLVSVTIKKYEELEAKAKQETWRMMSKLKPECGCKTMKSVAEKHTEAKDQPEDGSKSSHPTETRETNEVLSNHPQLFNDSYENANSPSQPQPSGDSSEEHRDIRPVLTQDSSSSAGNVPKELKAESQTTKISEKQATLNSETTSTPPPFTVNQKCTRIAPKGRPRLKKVSQNPPLPV